MGNRRMAELVSEFVPLNRRRTQGDPPLSVLELDRWSELRDLLAYEFGHGTPIGPQKQPRQLRVPTHLKVRYGDSAENDATIENLSEGGLFVRCAQPLAPGTPLKIELDAEGEPPVKLEAVVAHSRDLDNLDGPAGFGVEFQNVEAEEHVIITRLVEGVLSSAAGD